MLIGQSTGPPVRIDDNTYIYINIIHTNQLTCKLSKFLIGVFNDPLEDNDTDVKWENGFDVKLVLSCIDESSGLLPVDVVPANVPMQLPLIDEFDNDEFDSDNEFRRP